MKAIVLNQYGDASQLHLAEVAEPRPGSGEIKVAVVSSSINPIDWKLRRGDYKTNQPVQFPFIPGVDVSGVVIEVGASVSGYKVGDRVLGFVQRGYAEYVTAPAESWAHLPAGTDPIDAAAIPVAALTGVQLVEEGAKVRNGQIVLITGAVGSVGRFAAYAARARGAQMIAGVRHSQLADAQRLGATSVIALDDESSIDSLPALDAICDTIGGKLLSSLVRKVKRGGVIASTVNEPKEAHSRDIETRLIHTHVDSARLAACARAVASGELRLPSVRRLPFPQAAQAQSIAERGGAGKVLLVV